VTILEHKATPVRRRPEVTGPMRVQLALQAAALSEMGRTVAGQAVYFTQHHTRVPVELTPEDHANARDLVAATSETLTSPTAPPPLEDDPRCTRCSHIGVCLPDERKLSDVPRRIMVADPDSEVLHLATPGSRAAIRSGRVEVHHRGERVGSVPIERVQAVVAHGNVDLSGALIRELLWRRIIVLWCSSTGRVIGWSTPAASINGGPRHRQHIASATGRIDLAREFISAKITNQATLLRRHGDAPEAVERLRALQRQALAGSSLEELCGIEGDAAARYFAHFHTMLSERVTSEQVTFTGRTRRPARDPVNAALNFCYGLLLTDVIRAVASCGLDPHAGFLHSSERNKPALALDLCEELRAPVADSVVIGAFNNGELKARDFTAVLGSTNLRERGRRALIAAYERRMNGKFQHPLFGYKVTWRRAAEIQARLVLGVVDGTQPEYRGIRVR
jgi:CRISPR-associated protein Cas1